MNPQEIVNRINQLSRQIAPLQGKIRNGVEDQEYQRLNGQRNALIQSVPGLQETYEKGIHGYLLSYGNNKPLPDSGLSYDELKTWAAKDAEITARNTYEAKPGATLPEPSATYKADVAKTEGIQLNPQTKAVEAKPGYQISPTGEVSRKPEGPPEPEPEKLPPITDIAGVRPDEGLVLFKGDNKWRKASDYSINNRVLEGTTLRDLGEQITREPANIDESERVHLPGMADNEWLPKTDWNKIPPNQQEIAKAQGLDGLKEAVAKAENALADFHNKDGSYNLGDALNEHKAKVNDAVDLLFSPADIEKAKYENKPALTIGTGPEKPKQTVKFQTSPISTLSATSEQVTGPEPGTVVEPELRDELRNIPGVKLALGAVAITAATPVPGDELVALGVLAALATSWEISKTIKSYRDETGSLPKPQDVVVAKDGQAFGIMPESLKTTGYHPLTPPAYPQAKEEFKPTKDMPKLEGYRAANIERVSEGIKALQPEAVVITFPATRPEELTGQTAGLLLAKAKVDTAQRELQLEVKHSQFDKNEVFAILEVARRHELPPSTYKSISERYGGGTPLSTEQQQQMAQDNAAAFGVQWQSAENARTLDRQEAMYKTWAETAQQARAAGMTRAANWVYENAVSIARQQTTAQARAIGMRQAHFIKKAYQNYVMKLAALEAAKHSYISFVNPLPVKGTLNQQSLSAIAGYKLAQSLGVKGAASTSLEQALAQSTATKSAVKAGQLAYTMAKSQGMTDTQADMKAQQAVQAAVKQALAQAMQPATKTATRTATQAATASQTATGTRTATRTTTRDLTRTQELTRTAELTTTGIPILKKRDEPKREWTQKDISSATAFRMGAIGKPLKPVTIALRSPYGPGDKKTFVGATPEGLKVAPNALSAKKTIQLLHGKSPDHVITKIGFQTVRISRPSSQPGVKGAISFTPGKVTLRSKKLAQGMWVTESSTGQKMYSRFPITRRRRRRG